MQVNIKHRFLTKYYLRSIYIFLLIASGSKLRAEVNTPSFERDKSYMACTLDAFQRDSGEKINVYSRGVACSLRGTREVAEKIPVLIIDGFSNHNWTVNTKYLLAILEGTGKFQVDVSTCPLPGKDSMAWENWNPEFEKYPVVIQTCNNIKDAKLTWPVNVKQSFERYISSGGGVYIYHGANNAFKNWKAYNDIIGLGWRDKDFGVALVIDDNEEVISVPKGEGGNTGHGKRADVLITRINEHPIHKGMPKSWLAADLEVYRYARGPAKNVEVISYAKDVKTGLNFPSEWVVKYGRGNVYCSTYGHLWKDQEWPESMRCAAFQQSFVRALQWLSGKKVDGFFVEEFPSKEEIMLNEPIKK